MGGGGQSADEKSASTPIPGSRGKARTTKTTRMARSPRDEKQLTERKNIVKVIRALWFGSVRLFTDHHGGGYDFPVSGRKSLVLLENHLLAPHLAGRKTGQRNRQKERVTSNVPDSNRAVVELLVRTFQCA